MIFLLQNLISISLAMTLESNCSQLKISKSNISQKIVKNIDCSNNKSLTQENQFHKKKYVPLFATTPDTKDKFVIDRITIDAYFCQLPVDYISRIDQVTNKRTQTWNAKDNFKEIFNSVSLYHVLVRDRFNMNKTCTPFPGFTKIKSIVTKNPALPEHLKKIKSPLFVLLSTSTPTIYFMNSTLTKIVWAMNLSLETTINDIVFAKNGDAVILTIHTGLTSPAAGGNCLEFWDLPTGTMMRQTCSYRYYDEQIIFEYDNYIVWAFEKDNSLYFEFYDEIGTLIKSQKVPKPLNFRLSNAHLY